MYVTMVCKDRNQKEKNELYEVLGAIAQREKVQIEEHGDVVELDVCPQGKLVVSEEEDSILIHANTRHAGPGFHAFVVDICKDIQEELDGEFELFDDLEYAEHEDFDKLYSMYEEELEYLRNALLNNENLKSQNYLYDETFMLPIEKKDRIFTSTGDMDLKEFKEMNLNDLMDNFYVWNDWNKDAQYFKNCALVLLAKEGVNQYTLMNESTQKYAETICDFIELAYDEDPTISLPVKEYIYLCSLLGRKNQLMTAKKMDEEVIQYKDGEVYHLFQDAKVVAHGASERSFDPVLNALCLMSPYLDDASWDWLIQASKEPGICSYLDELESSEPIIYQDKVIYFYEFDESGFYSLEAKLVDDERVLYFHITIAKKEDIPYLKQCVKESGFQKTI